MNDLILANIGNPEDLERLYRQHKSAFKKAFAQVYPDIQHMPEATVWHARLSYEDADISWGSGKEWLFVLLSCFLAWGIAKIPAFFPVSDDFFYARNMGFVVFPFLTLYFAWKHKPSTAVLMVATMGTLAAAVFINVLPNMPSSDTLHLACIHLPLFLWGLLCVVFVGKWRGEYPKKLVFLRYNGDVLVITALILIAGVVLTGITIGLFGLIQINISQFYLRYIAVLGAVSAPLIGTHITQKNSELVGRVSPVIAKIFSPFVLVTLSVYLVAMVFSEHNLYQDRDFLMTFNLLLVGVMAIILFSVTGVVQSARDRMFLGVLFLLSLVTIVVNGMALSAIVYRLAEGGMTPNRMAVLGGNVLILLHLLWVACQLLRTLRQKAGAEAIEKALVLFLPVYAIWVSIVLFLFPIVFRFK